MKLNDIPKLMPVPFGVNGPREELLEASPAGNRSASYADGFPPITMLLKQAGGLPPKGENMNQILFELANGQRWSNSGAGYKFNKAFSEAVGGYPKGAQLLSNDGTKVYVSTKDDNKTDFNTSPGPDWVTLGDYIGLGNYATKTDVGLKLDKTSVVQATGTSTTSVISQDGATKAFQAAGYSYSKAESDNNFQPKGNYQPLGNYLNKDSTEVQVVSGEIQSKGRVGSIFDEVKLSFLTGRNGLPVWGSYDGTNFHYVNHPKKSGTAALISDLFGIEQEWYDLKNERSVGVNYKNNTPKPICLFVRLGSSQYQTTEIKVGGKTVAMWTSLGTTASTTSQGAFTVIPPGASYAVIANQGNSNVLDWTEFR